jgi:hypothetical protein
MDDACLSVRLRHRNSAPSLLQIKNTYRFISLTPYRFLIGLFECGECSLGSDKLIRTLAVLLNNAPPGTLPDGVFLSAGHAHGVPRFPTQGREG